MIRGAVELVEQRRAGRARALLKLEARCRAAFEPRPGVLRETRKHEVVDHQGVLAGREQLRQPYFGGTAVRSCPLEDVILRHEPSWRQMPPGFRHGLHRTAKLDLLFEEAVSRHSIAGRLAWKPHADAHALTHPLLSDPSLRPGLLYSTINFDQFRFGKFYGGCRKRARGRTTNFRAIYRDFEGMVRHKVFDCPRAAPGGAALY